MIAYFTLLVFKISSIGIYLLFQLDSHFEVEYDNLKLQLCAHTIFSGSLLTFTILVYVSCINLVQDQRSLFFALLSAWWNNQTLYVDITVLISRKIAMFVF